VKPARGAGRHRRGRESRSATSARSAGKPRSSTRRAARSACPAASTNAEAGALTLQEGTSDWSPLCPGWRSIQSLGARMPACFRVGTYHEVKRWLWNFLTSHAKRTDPRVEVVLEEEAVQVPRANSSAVGVLARRASATPSRRSLAGRPRMRSARLVHQARLRRLSATSRNANSMAGPTR